MEDKREWKKWKKMQCHPGRGGGGALYGLGIIGALFYFLQNAHSFAEAVVGILKALVWPALLIYKALQLLKI
jgi:hypothetical protein